MSADWGDDDDDDIPESGTDWRRARGIFIIAPLSGAAGERVARLQQQYDPKLARSSTPHVTLVGSSGVGPIRPDTTVDELRMRLEPITRATPPIELTFGAPMRFMQTNIISLPLDPNGVLRPLFERIRGSGLRFLPVRFSFSPHATLSFYPTLNRARERELLALRIPEPLMLDRLVLSLTDDPHPPRRLLELSLGG